MSEQATIENGRQIYGLLPKVMADIGAIGKGKTNMQQNYKFRGIDDALDAINPALVKNSVTLAVNVLEHRLEDTPTGEPDQQGKVNPKHRMIRCVLKLQLRFIAPDGSFVDNVTVGEALDYNGDKATNKAMSVAAKYAFFLGLCIPVADKVLDDSDHEPKPPENGDNGSQKPRASSNGAANGSSAKPSHNRASNKDPYKDWESKIVASSAPPQLRAMKNGIGKDAKLSDDQKKQLQEMAENAALRLEKAVETAGAPPS